MKQFLTIITAAALGLAIFYAPLPLAPGAEEFKVRLYIAAFAAAAGVFSLAGLLFSQTKLVTSRTAISGWLLTASALGFAYYSLKHPDSIWLSALICLFAVFTFSLFVKSEEKIPYSAVCGFLLFVALAVSAEGTLRSLPQQTLAKHVRSTPPLVQPDQVNIVYKKNWFRGKRPCVNCPENNIRIITLGGSSTYGVPMFYGSLSYTESLQRLLDERRPGEHYEVLNAGVAAYGITQVIAALKEELLKYKPTVVSVCSWFNDSAPNNRWYQTPGISDYEAYERHRALQRLGELPLYKKIRASKLFALSRWSLLGLKSALFTGSGAGHRGPNIPRMTPEQFRWGLEEVVRLGKKHDFLPVFVLEALHRTDSLENSKRSNKYYQAIFSVAKDNNLPVVDTVSRLHDVKDFWVFHDFIHPNSVGHRVIAESMYEDLIANPVSEHARRFLESRGVDFSKPDVRLVVKRAELSERLVDNGLSLTLRAPYLDDSPAKVEVVINNKSTVTFDGLGTDFKQFKIPKTEFDNVRPITDIRASAVVDRTNDPKWAIGSTGLSAPVLIDATSGGKNYGWRVEVSVDGQRIDSNGRGYNVSVIDAVKGNVIKQSHFDTFGSKKKAAELAAYLKGLGTAYEGQKIIVVVAVKTDGRHHLDTQATASALKSLGGSGELPNAMESFLLIGTPGAAEGSAYEEMGKKLVHKIIGTKQQAYARLLEVQN